MPELPRRRGSGVIVRATPAKLVSSRPMPQPQPDVQLSIARFFRELRSGLQITPHQAAAELLTQVEVIAALEAGDTVHLPAWPETQRIVMTYAGWARVDGRPLLAAISSLQARQSAVSNPAPAGQTARRVPMQASSERLRRAGNALAQGAKRLPRDAIQQAKQRPVRTLYTLSLPIAGLILLLNTSLLQSAVVNLPSSFVHVLKGGRELLTAYWAPVREGLRWIDVDDPRARRGDKLQISGH